MPYVNLIKVGRVGASAGGVETFILLYNSMKTPKRGEHLRAHAALFDTWMIMSVIRCALSMNWAFGAQTYA